MNVLHTPSKCSRSTLFLLWSSGKVHVLISIYTSISFRIFTRSPWSSKRLYCCDEYQLCYLLWLRASMVLGSRVEGISHDSSFQSTWLNTRSTTASRTAGCRRGNWRLFHRGMGRRDWRSADREPFLLVETRCGLWVVRRPVSLTRQPLM